MNGIIFRQKDEIRMSHGKIKAMRDSLSLIKRTPSLF